MTSRILGLVRDQVLASLFGATDAMDAFNVAFRLPNLLRDLFAEGAMSAAFVPTFTAYLTRRSREAVWRLANSVVNALLLATGLIVLAGIIGAEPLVRLFAGDFARVPGKLELTIQLARIVFPFLTMVAIAAAFMGILNAHDKFFIPAVSPSMFNVGTIVAAFLLVPLMPAVGLEPIVGIAIGTLLGGLGQLLQQVPSLRGVGYRYRPVLDLRDEGLRRILLLMGPGTIAQAAVQVNLLINTMLAARQGTGSVSWLNYAFRLMYLPIGLFGVSIATAAVPTLSRLAAQEDRAGMRDTLSHGLRLMLLLNVPAAVGLIALASPIVSLIFERGAFTSADTAATAAALIFYAPGLIGYSAVKLVVPIFYALDRSRTPVMVSFFAIGVNVALSLLLVGTLGYRGLALATAVAALVNASMLLMALRGHFGGIDGRRLARTCWKIGLASLVMGLSAWSAERLLQDFLPGRSVLAQGARLGISIVGGLFVLAAVASVLKIEEFSEAVRLITRRFSRRRDESSNP